MMVIVMIFQREADSQNLPHPCANEHIKRRLQLPPTKKNNGQLEET